MTFRRLPQSKGAKAEVPGSGKGECAPSRRLLGGVKRNSHGGCPLGVGGEVTGIFSP